MTKSILFLLLNLLIVSSSALIAHTNHTPVNTDPEQRILEKDSLVKDINLLEQALTELHPGLYRYNSKTEIKQLFSKLKASLPEQIPENEFMIRLAQTVREIKCGHTYLNPWNLNRATRNRLFGGKTFFPIGFEIINGHFFSTETAFLEDHQIKRGAEILSINGISTQEIYKQLNTIAKFDGNNSSSIDHYLSLWNYEESTWQAFDLYLQLFYPLNKDHFEVTFRNFSKKKIQSIQVPALSKAKRAEMMKTKYGAAILGKEQWSLDIISEDIAVMRLGTFAIWKWKDFDQKQWFADAFQQLDSLGIEKLAIDIRGNGGGLSDPANELLSYLISDSLKCDDLGKIYIRTTKLNPDLLPFMDLYVEGLKTGLPANMYQAAENDLYELFEPSQCTDIAPQENRFSGETLIFGNSSNVSATFTLLKKANQFGFATYVGQESGGNQQGINGGQYAFFHLPYSKFEVDIPLKYFAPKSERPDAGVQPKVPIQITQEDIAKGRDPYLNYLEKY